MEKKEKRPYERPRVARIRLDAEGAVLGFCKTTGKVGPGNDDCDLPGGCSAEGS